MVKTSNRQSAKGEAWIAIILKTRLMSAAALTKLSFSTVWRRFLEGGAYRKIGRDKDKLSFDLTAVSLSAPKFHGN